MPIFIQQEGQLKKLKVEALSKEKDLQFLIEQNLGEVLEMYILATEYPTTFGGRIDTLAIDLNGAPVIIEYKRNKNDNVINQALSYLHWLKAQKVEFLEMLMIKKLGQEVANKIQVDWDNPRVICVAESYSKFDIQAVEVVPIRIELFKYHLYERGIFHLELINIVEKTIEKEKVKKIKVGEEAIKEVLQNTSNMRNLFEELRSRIMQIDEDIIEKVNNRYTTFKLSKSFADVHIRRNSLTINLRHLTYDDPSKLIHKVPDTHQWTLDHILTINNLNELDYGMKFIEQSYKDVI